MLTCPSRSCWRASGVMLVRSGDRGARSPAASRCCRSRGRMRSSASAPVFASLTIASMPSDAIFDGYCWLVAPMMPDFTWPTPVQPPSIETRMVDLLLAGRLERLVRAVRRGLVDRVDHVDVRVLGEDGLHRRAAVGRVTVRRLVAGDRVRCRPCRRCSCRSWPRCRSCSMSGTVIPMPFRKPWSRLRSTETTCVLNRSSMAMSADLPFSWAAVHLPIASPAAKLSVANVMSTDDGGVGTVSSAIT